MPAMEMQHTKDPRAALLEELGDLSNFEPMNNQILVAIYKRPDVKTKGGILLTDRHRDEDRFQSKVGLIVKLGPDAFKSGDGWFVHSRPKLHDWVVHRASDGWACSVNMVDCRMMDDIAIRAVVHGLPDMVW